MFRPFPKRAMDLAASREPGGSGTIQVSGLQAPSMCSTPEGNLILRRVNHVGGRLALDRFIMAPADDR